MTYMKPGAPSAIFTYKTQYQNYINGEWTKPVQGRYFDNISPIDGQTFTSVPVPQKRMLNWRLTQHIKPFQFGLKRVLQKDPISYLKLPIV